MKLFSSSRQPDPALYVYSSVRGFFYYCPDAAAVDAHLIEVLGHLGPASNLTASATAHALRDVDQLLDRRAFLQVVGESPTRRELSDLAAHDRRLVA